MIAWIAAFLVIVIYFVNEWFGTKKEERNKEFWNKVGIVVSLMLLIQVVNYAEGILKQNKLKKQVK